MQFQMESLCHFISICLKNDGKFSHSDKYGTTFCQSAVIEFTFKKKYYIFLMKYVILLRDNYYVTYATDGNISGR